MSTTTLLFSLRVAASFRPDHGPRDFSKMDADGDGLLSAAEIEAHTDERLRAEIDGFMSFFDADGDYKVTKAEYDAEASKFFTTDPLTEAWFWKSLFPTSGESSDGYADSRRLSSRVLREVDPCCTARARRTVDVQMLRRKKSLLLTASAQEKSRQVRCGTRASRHSLMSQNARLHAQWMAEHDKNNDKEVTRAEYGKGDPSLWALLDPDGDGCVQLC